MERAIAYEEISAKYTHFINLFFWTIEIYFTKRFPQMYNKNLDKQK